MQVGVVQHAHSIELWIFQGMRLSGFCKFYANAEYVQHYTYMYMYLSCYSYVALWYMYVHYILLFRKPDINNFNSF